MRHPNAPEPEEPWGTSEERSRKPWWGKLAKPREVPDHTDADLDAVRVRAEKAEALLREAMVLIEAWGPRDHRASGNGDCAECGNDWPCFDARVAAFLAGFVKEGETE